MSFCSARVTTILAPGTVRNRKKAYSAHVVDLPVIRPLCKTLETYHHLLSNTEEVNKKRYYEKY